MLAYESMTHLAWTLLAISTSLLSMFSTLSCSLNSDIVHKITKKIRERKSSARACEENQEDLSSLSRLQDSQNQSCHTSKGDVKRSGFGNRCPSVFPLIRVENRIPEYYQHFTSIATSPKKRSLMEGVIKIEKSLSQPKFAGKNLGSDWLFVMVLTSSPLAMPKNVDMTDSLWRSVMSCELNMLRNETVHFLSEVSRNNLNRRTMYVPMAQWCAFLALPPQLPGPSS